MPEGGASKQIQPTVSCAGANHMKGSCSIVVGNALFAHFGKDPKEVCESEHFLHARAQVDQPQFASGSLTCHINPHQRSQAHAVNPLQFSEVQNNQLAIRYEPTDLVAEKAADAGNEPASAMNDGLRALSVDFDGQGDRSSLGWHRFYLGPGGLEPDG